jgi:hypothetical protein
MISTIETRGSGAGLYQMKVTLKWTKPPIWRRVVVREDLKLDRLHWVIQLAMGWTNSHLHQFITGVQSYGVPDPDYDDMGTKMLNEKRYTVADLARSGNKKFIYEYDFGDGWAHEVKIEKVLPPDAGFKHPVCLGGANACPPEDCGGIPGFYNFVEAMGNPNHPEHEELKEWYGGEWDATRFEVEEVNQELKSLPKKNGA